MKPEQSKLAIFINAYFYSDGESYYTDENAIVYYLKIAKEFAKVLVFAPIQYKNIVNKEKLYRISGRDVEFVAIPYYSGNVYSLLRTGYKTIPSLYNTLKSLRDKFDLLWLSNPPNPLDLVFSLFCERAKIPIVFFIRQDMILILKSRFKGFIKYFPILIAKIIDLYIRILLKKYPAFVSGNKLFIRYKGKDNLVYKLFNNLLDEDDIIMPSQLNRKKHSGKLRVLGVGRFEKEKGFEYLLQAINLLVNSYQEDVHLALIGTGSQERKLREYVRTNRLEDYIDIVPFIKHGKEFFDYFKNADLYVQPSLTEGFPKTIFEAMAKGVPLIVSQVGDMPYIVKEGINGLTVKPQSTKAIAKAILHYKHNPHLLKRFALYNLDYVKQFVFEKQKDIIIDVIKNLTLK